MPFTVLTALRVRYFGSPFPNTYYAKISTDLPATLLGGAEYVLLSVIELNFMALSLAVWLAIAFSLLQSGSRAAWQGQALAVVGTIIGTLGGFLLIVCLTGGDHFNGQRFLQPVWPVVIIGLALVVAAALDAFCALVTRARLDASAALVGMVVVMTQNILFAGESRRHRDATRSIFVEFRIADEGLRLGSRLQTLAARHDGFSIGVVAAGGVALTFHGPVYDLMGLNWVEMAHARQDKVGLRSHASFDPEVFFRALPDVLPLGHRVGGFINSATSGLLLTERFRAAYLPVVAHDNEGELYLFITRRWLAVGAAADLREVGWHEVTVDEPCWVGWFHRTVCRALSHR